MRNDQITALSIIYPPVYGGPHNTLVTINDRLADLGVHSIVLLPAEAVSAVDRMRSHGLEVVTIPLHRMRFLFDPRVHARWLRHVSREADAMVDLIKDRRVDVVATNSLPNLQGGMAARRADVACVWELIDSFPPPVIRRLYMPLVLRLSDVVMTTGRKVAEGHPGTTTLGERWVNFYPAVDTERFRADSAVRRQAREELGLRPDSVVVGNVSNLNPMKGHRYFLEAAGLVLRTNPDTQFVILGATYEERADYYRTLWRLADDVGLRRGVNLLVSDPGSRVAELAQAIDIFWMTSEVRSEGLPTVIGEAKSLGLPVITTDAGSTSECVTPGRSGWVVQPRDVESIARYTRELIGSPGKRAAMGSRARVEAEADFDADRTAESHRRAFDLAIAHHAETGNGPKGRRR